MPVTAPITPAATPRVDRDSALSPRYHVVLLDDDDHSYDYVTEMLLKLFQINHDDGLKHAQEVDQTGRTIVLTTHLERAEFKRDQILGYGADPRMAHSPGSMRADLEPA